MSLVDLLFPKKCLQCSRNGTYICTRCINKVRIAKQICLECQKPAIDGVTHSGCLKPLGLHGSLAGFEYKWVVKKAIKSLKYRFATEMAEEIAIYLVDHLKNSIHALPKDTVLVPIPLHKKRLNWRGFNQSEELGRVVARRMRWNFHPSLLVRKKYTIPQVELKGDKRKSNVQGIFNINPKYQKSIINNQSLIIFDDVITSGATVREACKVIKRYNKSLTIWGLSIAR